jgi:cytochrome c553
MHKFICFVGLLLLMSSCSNTDSLADVDSLPVGNAEQGAVLFAESINGAPACATCHHVTDEPFVGPALAGYGQRAATEVEGLSAEVYTYESIVRPASHIVNGYANVMYPQYASKLTNQALADIIAYLLTL